MKCCYLFDKLFQECFSCVYFSSIETIVLSNGVKVFKCLHLCKYTPIKQLKLNF